MKLMAVTDDTHSVPELADKIIRIQQRIDCIQIREKTKTEEEILALAALLEDREFPKEKLILNSQADLAWAAGIPAVHLPESGESVKTIKQRYPQLRIGRSVHSLEGARQAEIDGADYVMYGHCFETNSKKGQAPNGLHPLKKIKEELTIPVYAIGGITADRIPMVTADGIAVMSGIFSVQDPLASTIQLYEAMKR
ncbi:thiamine phosphate synthase [Bacillus massiliglaciei]|uniref:thiamine phosphate synthase n=1 Tax=Bacillus massiliglaciei TaxID=1816693 RepID=UPI000A88526D|nr:thiamine phosphate synthase [Bacillus massiliglaciei]